MILRILLLFSSLFLSWQISLYFPRRYPTMKAMTIKWAVLKTSCDFVLITWSFAKTVRHSFANTFFLSRGWILQKPLSRAFAADLAIWGWRNRNLSKGRITILRELSHTMDFSVLHSANLSLWFTYLLVMNTLVDFHHDTHYSSWNVSWYLISQSRVRAEVKIGLVSPCSLCEYEKKLKATWNWQKFGSGISLVWQPWRRARSWKTNGSSQLRVWLSMRSRSVWWLNTLSLLPIKALCNLNKKKHGSVKWFSWLGKSFQIIVNILLSFVSVSPERSSTSVQTHGMRGFCRNIWWGGIYHPWHDWIWLPCLQLWYPGRPKP